MCSISLRLQYIAAPTPPPLAPYTPLSRELTRLDTTPRVSTAFGVLQRILSLTTTATTSTFKWLALGSLSRRRVLSPTLTTTCYREPTPTALVAFGKSSPHIMIIAIPPLVLLVSILFGACLVHLPHGKSSRSFFTVGNLQARLRTTNIRTPPDGNETLVAPSSDFIMLPKDVKKLLLACTKIIPTFTRTPDATDKPAYPFALGNDVVPLYYGGEDTNPTLNHRWSSRYRQSTSPDTVVARISVEPARVPERPLTTCSKSAYKLSLPTRLTSDDCPSTPTRNRATVSSSVEPSGAPDGVTAAGRPRAESMYLKEVRRLFQRCLREDYEDQAETCIPQPCFVHPRSQPNYIKADPITFSVRPLDPPVEIDVPVKKEERPETLWSPDTLWKRPKCALMHPTHPSNSTRPRPLTSTLPQTGPTTAGRNELQSTQNRSTDKNKVSTLFKSVETAQDRARKAIERAREAATITDTRVRPSRPKAVGLTNEESARGKGQGLRAQLRREHEELMARVHAKLRYYEEKRATHDQNGKRAVTGESHPIEQVSVVEDSPEAIVEDARHSEHSEEDMVEDSWTAAGYFPPATPDRTVDRGSVRVEQPASLVEDVFYSTPTTDFLNGEKVRGFGVGSPCARKIQRLDPRDNFETSTPRVNYANFRGFCTSTPRKDVDHRKDNWADFF